MSEQKFDRDVLLEELRSGIVKLEFTKKDGTHRLMFATLRPDMMEEDMVPDETKEALVDPNVIRCYDFEIDEWRSFRIDSLLTVEKMQMIVG